MKILCCEALASSCSSKGLAQGRKNARLSHALIAKHSRKLQGLCLRLQAATSVTHANLCRYVCTPVSPGLRWPGQAITGSWPPACFMKISHVHVCMCTNFGSDALRSWPRTVHTHTALDGRCMNSMCLGVTPCLHVQSSYIHKAHCFGRWLLRSS